MITSPKWTNEFLDEMRKHGDPVADRAAAALFDATKGHSPADVAQFITSFVAHDFPQKWEKEQTVIPDPPELIAYFESSDEFKWTDTEVTYLQKGSDFFEKHGPWITFALGIRSLLKQYAHTKAIEVLRLTTLLVKHVNRRVLETMQFVLDVMSLGWDTKTPDGHKKLNLEHPGLMSIKKLRLLHAMIRFRLLHKMYDTSLGEYDIEKLGFPINQEDMVFAIHTFSLEIIEGLRELRVSVTEDEAENYFECWKIIGRGLGIDPKLEPADYADATTLQQIIYQRHYTLPNPVGPILSKALTDWFTTSIPLLDQKILITLIKDVNGPENYSILQDNLDIDIGDTHPDIREHLAKDERFMEKTARPGLVVTEHGTLALDNFFLHFIRTLLKTERGGKNSTFRIGDGFIASWNLNNMDETPLSKGKIFWLVVKDLFSKLLKSIKSLIGRETKPA
ncbi:MAG: oxygenase MpaB family protein [Saprospiraceae bacterium]